MFRQKQDKMFEAAWGSGPQRRLEWDIAARMFGSTHGCTEIRVLKKFFFEKNISPLVQYVVHLTQRRDRTGKARVSKKKNKNRGKTETRIHFLLMDPSYVVRTCTCVQEFGQIRHGLSLSLVGGKYKLSYEAQGVTPTKNYLLVPWSNHSFKKSAFLSFLGWAHTKVSFVRKRSFLQQIYFSFLTRAMKHLLFGLFLTLLTLHPPAELAYGQPRTGVRTFARTCGEIWP